MKLLSFYETNVSFQYKDLAIAFTIVYQLVAALLCLSVLRKCPMDERVALASADRPGREVSRQRAVERAGGKIDALACAVPRQ